jgi:drug/metabolite transporter (DMT)-like permease
MPNSLQKTGTVAGTVTLLLNNAQLQMHLCVLLWGFTAILGKLISLGAIPLVFWRVSMVSACLLLWPPVLRQLSRVDRHDLALAIAAGVLITAHWLSFYGAIKLSNASVGVASIALAPMVLSFAEPLLSRQPFSAGDTLLAVLSIVGVVFVVGGIPPTMTAGFALGALSAFFVAIFSIVNKRLTMRVPALGLTAIEMGTGVLLLGVLIPAWPDFGAAFGWPDRRDMLLLLVLSLLCTLVPFVLSMVALRKLSAFNAQLAVNLEPVYAILLAAAFLGESGQLRWPFYLGVVVILSSVLLHLRLNRPGARSRSAASSPPRPAHRPRR